MESKGDWIVSIDPGKTNFAFCIGETDFDTISKIQNIPKNERYEIDGNPAPKFDNILEDMFSRGRIVLFKNTNLTKNCVKGKYLDSEVFHNLTELLDDHVEYWDKCRIVIIEQQMNRNPMALKIAQHCYSYFIFKYGRFKQVMEFPAYYKTQVLGAPKNVSYTKKGKARYKALTKPERKKWAIEKATEILIARNEFRSLSDILSSRKKDDICDCVLMIEAFKYLAFVDRVI